MQPSKDRRSFLKITGTTLGIGVLYSAMPAAAAGGEVGEFFSALGKKSGERVTPFSFLQLSDTHVGFNGPPIPWDQSLRAGSGMINAVAPAARPAAVYRGPDTRRRRKRRPRATHEAVPGNLAAVSMFLNLGACRASMMPASTAAPCSASSWGPRIIPSTIAASTSSRSTTFRARSPRSAPSNCAWMKTDLARFPKSAPIVVFTHRPLFDLKPEWEWFTSDGDDVMNLLAPYENVTVLYGHIHRDNVHDQAHIHHLCGAIVDLRLSGSATRRRTKSRIPFDKDQPFKNLGIRLVHEAPGDKPALTSVSLEDIELSSRQFSGINGIQQFLKNANL